MIMVIISLELLVLMGISSEVYYFPPVSMAHKKTVVISQGRKRDIPSRKYRKISVKEVCNLVNAILMISKPLECRGEELPTSLMRITNCA